MGRQGWSRRKNLISSILNDFLLIVFTLLIIFFIAFLTCFILVMSQGIIVTLGLTFFKFVFLPFRNKNILAISAPMPLPPSVIQMRFILLYPLTSTKRGGTYLYNL